MKNLLLVFCCVFLSRNAFAQIPTTIKEEQATQAVRTTIAARVAAMKVSYHPEEFQTGPYPNPENNATFVGGTMVVHRFHIKDSTGFVKPYHVSYLVTTVGKVYVLEVFNPRR
ncbi:hypothetical protein [Hymenobacter volaticus]|uniref:NTF2 fold domain-containing protein n=1 Tax=Hymenobacter volaticus TaxID=2932254 RepID=A0ABY4GD41_9BACT|nr:hypothetical protein [Hymenobacter volaticus]UOQ68804.1 hypothetical protein MUN86_25360 [Hymenobacter volaticus]